MRNTLAALLVIAVLSLGAGTILFGLTTGAEEPDPLLGTANGAEIRQSDLEAALAQLPPPYASLPRAQIAPLVMQQLILDALLLEAAEGDEIAGSERFQALVARESDRLLRDVYLEQRIDAALTDERLQAAYDRYLEANPPEREIRARHILVEERAAAEALIAELQGGADFAELARENSTGPSGPSGGDLGWFSEGMMVPAFSEAAFALEVGGITETPVETQFGWHVITVTDERQSEPASFEEVEPQLRDDLSRTIAQNLLDELRSTASIELTEAAPSLPEENTADESPAPAPAQAPAP